MSLNGFLNSIQTQFLYVFVFVSAPVGSPNVESDRGVDDRVEGGGEVVYEYMLFDCKKRNLHVIFGYMAY